MSRGRASWKPGARLGAQTAERKRSAGHLPRRTLWESSVSAISSSSFRMRATVFFCCATTSALALRRTALCASTPPFESLKGSGCLRVPTLTRHARKSLFERVPRKHRSSRRLTKRADNLQQYVCEDVKITFRALTSASLLPRTPRTCPWSLARFESPSSKGSPPRGQQSEKTGPAHVCVSHQSFAAMCVQLDACLEVVRCFHLDCSLERVLVNDIPRLLFLCGFRDSSWFWLRSRRLAPSTPLLLLLLFLRLAAPFLHRRCARRTATCRSDGPSDTKQQLPYRRRDV